MTNTHTRMDSATAPVAVVRFDSVRLDASRFTRTPQGGLVVDATLTRSGVFEYPRTDGKPGVVREYRPPGEVFSPESLATLADAPVTFLHPNPRDFPEMVTAENFSRLARGHTRDIRQDGTEVAARLVVQDAGLVASALGGKTREVSCGYRCRLDATPGTTPEGQPYDIVQRDIRYNHVALVPAGRAGTAKLRLDAAGNETPEGAEEKTMESIRIDGVDYPLGTEAERKAAGAAMVRYQAKLDTNQTQATGLQARLDATQAELVQVKADLAAAQDPVRMDAAVRERVALHATAAAVTKATGDALVKLDSLDCDGLRRTVIGATFPDIKLDGKDSHYLAALYDAAVAKVRMDTAKDPHGHGKARAALASVPAAPGVRQDSDKAETDPRAARTRMDQANAAAWTAPLAFSRKD